MPDASAIARRLGARPILIVGGAVGLLLLARLNASRSADVPADVPAEDPAADPSAVATDDGSGLGLGYNYGSPLAGYTFDPFADSYGTDTGTVETTPEGCPLPKPKVPETEGYKGNGEWVCDASAKTWVWRWNTTGKGCPLPKPTVPVPLLATHVYKCNDQTNRWELVSKVTEGGCKLAERPTAPPAGKASGSGEWVCDAGAWKWKPKTGNPPPPDGSGTITIPAGNHRTWAVDRTAKRAHDPEPWKLDKAVTRKTGPVVRGIAFPAGSGGSPAAVVRLTDGAKSGRWVRVQIGTWKADA